MSALLPLEEAQQRLVSLATRLPIETVPIAQALGRYLAADIAAHRNQPAADMSAMDGYAIRFEDRAGPWTCVGECKAGSEPCPPLKSGQTARIFTGALLPGGADTVVMQENVETDGNVISLIAEPSPEQGRHVRRIGSDFCRGDIALSKGTWLSPAALGHAVIAGYGELPAHQKPNVAVVSTGDELVEPGARARSHQIPASNDVMVSAMLAGLTGETRALSRIADNMDALCAALDSARDCDIIVTIGGASVGDHDLVAPAFERLGGTIDFHKIAMKPGKPVMSGKLGNSVVLALPGNPGSAFVSATLLLLPLVRYMAGAAEYLPKYRSAQTTTTLPPTQNRAQFLRAQVDSVGITAFDSQDSAKLSVLAAANALLYRPANSDEELAGGTVHYISI
ncbi:molybdopterin molybdotransferase MoeA [Parasphingorhabdus halotolerans]|uniref:Molybdopterin molybdenumtransferase n=1 Tax=Parasphingorhabdus halotolerans TaxID=2725558 RepID=A0A6H2DJD8_9SPHN|nr:gephyrin-like molybdotransferase Glp [Parasphingorhabdus halotolerans]QJB68103.1 molybdopterin molybdotransferase MoeA [Parasphingorhabdus halotolerans]